MYTTNNQGKTLPRSRAAHYSQVEYDRLLDSTKRTPKKDYDDEVDLGTPEKPLNISVIDQGDLQKQVEAKLHYL